MMRFLRVLLAGLAVLPVGLSGCQDADHYSAAVKYGVRPDPMVIAPQPADLGDDVWDPDRPGLLPLLKPQDVLVAANPMSAKGMELFQKEKLRDPMLLPADIRKELDKVLTDLFGTPLEPRVKDLDSDARDKLKLADKDLKEGSRLYRIHCVNCHGVAGDGHGPTARWISPHPRDFRQGLFKFMSVDQTTQRNRPPRREDLYHTLRNGLEGTAMPSFMLLKHEELNYLVSYVIHLSVRGKSEFDTIANSFEYKFDKASGNFTVTQKDESKQDGLPKDVKLYLDPIVAKWVQSQQPESAIKVPDKYDPRKMQGPEAKVWKDKTDEQVAHIKGAVAQALFNNEKPRLPEAEQILALRGDKAADVNCKQCHNDYGRQAKFKFDSWGTLVRPNNFIVGVFRGGRRPVDIYHRIHSGISGTPMTPFGDSKTMSPNSIWDMVEFVQALSYPAMRNRLGVTID